MNILCGNSYLFVCYEVFIPSLQKKMLGNEGQLQIQISPFFAYRDFLGLASLLVYIYIYIYISPLSLRMAQT